MRLRTWRLCQAERLVKSRDEAFRRSLLARHQASVFVVALRFTHSAVFVFFWHLNSQEGRTHPGEVFKGSVYGILIAAPSANGGPEHLG